MDTLEKVYKKKKKSKAETDRYENTYHWMEDDTIRQNIWEAWPYIGPGAFDSSHVDNLLFNGKNDIMTIRRGVTVGMMLGSMTDDDAKFEP